MSCCCKRSPPSGDTPVRFTVRVTPRSSRNAIEWEQGILKVRLTAPPVDGVANNALIALLAKHLQLPRRSIRIVHGESSRQKIVEVTGMTEEEILVRLQTNQV